MSDGQNKHAFGAPGMEPRWTRSTKEGIGTAYHSSCRVWFTVSHGVVNELYYPHADQPNTRDLQLLITDGESFCHEERRNLKHHIEYPTKHTLYYRLTNTDPQGRYRVISDVIADPHASVFLKSSRIELLDESLRSKLRVYALLAPHMKGLGYGNSGAWCNMGGRKLLRAWREDVHLSFGAHPDFIRRSVGYVGASDGWQDLMKHRHMEWEFRTATDGNIALIGEINWAEEPQFVVAVAFGRGEQNAAAKLMQSLAVPFSQHLERYIKQWKRTDPGPENDLSAYTNDGGGMYRLSRVVLLTHEDKIFPGAMVASMSIPWGETKSDLERGGYHLVWTRDLVKSASALLASGQTSTPLRSLIWLASIQEFDGSVPQNTWIDGTAYWTGKQLDEIAAPILLAWRLRRAGALGLFDPWILVSRAARHLMLHGPVTGQERWEENSGYSPSALASVIAALVCAGDLAAECRNRSLGEFFLEYADWLSAHLEEWTVTTRGEVVREIPRHFIRITPADPNSPGQEADPDNAMIQLANGGGLHPARNIVSGDFLDLVRLGLRNPHDRLIRDSIAIIDRVVKYDLPQGPCWRRYNHDGYGQKDDGSAFDGTGTGRCWPLLTGERGHYELAAGRDPTPYIKAMEEFANVGGMMPEQVWDAEDLPAARMKRGGPTGSAMPLCWAHGEYIALVRSRKDGTPFDLITPAFERYVKAQAPHKFEIWTFAHQPPRMWQGKDLRILTANPSLVQWSSDNWASIHEMPPHDAGLECYHVDLPTDKLQGGTRVLFKFAADSTQREYAVTVVDQKRL